MASWNRTMTYSERVALDMVLRDGDSPLRALIILLIDRISMNEETRTRHTDPMVIAACDARIEAYRYCMMTAILVQADADASAAESRCEPCVGPGGIRGSF